MNQIRQWAFGMKPRRSTFHHRVRQIEAASKQLLEVSNEQLPQKQSGPAVSRVGW
ncbi:MAG: hypothetical protein R3C03_11650 [Pirellulaceae bacterium]